MKVTVEFSAQLAQRLGAASGALELADGATIQDACAAVAGLGGGAARPFLFDDAGRPRAGVMICRNGAQVARGSAESLADGDVLALLTPISGG